MHASLLCFRAITFHRNFIGNDSVSRKRFSYCCYTVNTKFMTCAFITLDMAISCDKTIHFTSSINAASWLVNSQLIIWYTQRSCFISMEMSQMTIINERKRNLMYIRKITVLFLIYFCNRTFLLGHVLSIRMHYVMLMFSCVYICKVFREQWVITDQLLYT